MALTLDVAVALRVVERLRRDLENPAVVEGVEDVDTREAAARVAGIGELDEPEDVLAEDDRPLFDSVITYVTVDMAEGTSIAVPDTFRHALAPE